MAVDETIEHGPMRPKSDVHLTPGLHCDHPHSTEAGWSKCCWCGREDTAPGVVEPAAEATMGGMG